VVAGAYYAQLLRRGHGRCEFAKSLQGASHRLADWWFEHCMPGKLGHCGHELTLDDLRQHSGSGHLLTRGYKQIAMGH